MTRVDLEKAREVLRRHRAWFFSLPGVVGVGISSREGEAVIEILLEREPSSGDIPAEIEGVPLRVRTVGELRAQREDVGAD
ncbi:MAG TPA: hypothetical protein ENF77_00025 [Candidatus Acetothermia bacterium]|nr:hypothetical protein [Candidatus Bipolaricaulota bacterium]HDI10702.1 hypothetical protein [Candidatus Acetothermia bacterium]